MIEFTTLLETENLHLYAKEFGNDHENTFDCIKVETGTSGTTYFSTFHVNMNEYTDKTLLDVLQYYHVTKFYGLEITEYPNMKTALKVEVLQNETSKLESHV